MRVVSCLCCVYDMPMLVLHAFCVRMLCVCQLALLLLCGFRLCCVDLPGLHSCCFGSAVALREGVGFREVGEGIQASVAANSRVLMLCECCHFARACVLPCTHATRWHCVNVHASVLKTVTVWCCHLFGSYALHGHFSFACAMPTQM